MLAAGSIIQVHDEQTASSYIYGKLQSGPQPCVPPAVPQLIAACNSSSDAVQAVQWAINHAVTIAVKGSGHHWAGLALAEGGLTIDLSNLQVLTGRDHVTQALTSGCKSSHLG